MLFGYFIGPFGALPSSGIFTSFLNKYFTNVLRLDTGFLAVLQLVSNVMKEDRNMWFLVMLGGSCYVAPT